ncbi:MAG: Gfo/Idh/MocA family oxidoreductase [Candidatus Hinthialibacter antarcticus]|nr:Gfo/Idh/MocA family oxidoreductase [Candidatus Hinthialibacter antarcticus]
MSDSNLTRREFFNKSGKISAVASAAAIAGPAINVMGANDVIRIGVIGPGQRGSYLMQMLTEVAMREELPIQYTAAADIFKGWRERAALKGEQMNEDAFDRAGKVAQYDHHKKLLEDKNVDAVIIATPEHQHAVQLIDAVQAGKDVYCEKPMVQNIAQGVKVLNACKGSKQVVQVGTQRRSVPLFYDARDMIKNGDIGDVTYCEGWWHRNFRPDQVGHAWRYAIPEDASPDSINWDEFHYDAKKHDFDKERYFQWRCYFDYSNGIGSDLMVHQVDAICCTMDVGIPKTLVASGGIYRWDDGRTTPDTWSSVMEFEEGFQLNYNSRFSNIGRHDLKMAMNYRIDNLDEDDQGDALDALDIMDEMKLLGEPIDDYGVRFCGVKGAIEVITHHRLHVWPEPTHIWPDNELTYKEMKFGRNVGDAVNLAVRTHMQNWVECMQTRETPNCTVQHGFDGAVISNMGTVSFTTGRRVEWDKANMKIKDV